MLVTMRLAPRWEHKCKWEIDWDPSDEAYDEECKVLTFTRVSDDTEDENVCIYLNREQLEALIDVAQYALKGIDQV